MMKQLRRIRHHLMTIAGSNAVIIAFLAALLLLLTYYPDRSPSVLMFGQLLAIFSFSVLAFICGMIFIDVVTDPDAPKGKEIPVILLGLGGMGKTLGLIAQIMQEQINNKPPIINISAVLICIGAIMILNKIYSNVEDVRD